MGEKSKPTDAHAEKGTHFGRALDEPNRKCNLWHLQPLFPSSICLRFLTLSEMYHDTQ